MSAQNFDHKSEKILITGASGCGKTSLSMALARKKKARVKFVFDYKAGELAHRMAIAALGEIGAVEQATARGGWVMFDRVKFFPGEPDKSFELFCEFVLAQIQILPGVKLFFADELQDYTDTSDANKPLALLQLGDIGRSLQLDMILVAQAPNRLHWALRNQVTEIYTFRQNEKNAIEPLAEKGFDPDEIRKLKNGEWLWRNLATGETKAGGKAF
jgi:energy-coupling factor transporter ATP-binding protein EcfA2